MHRSKISLRGIFAATALAILCSYSCKTKNKENTVSPTGVLKVTVNNVIGGQPVVFNNIQYTNAAGNAYSVRTLKYYVSHFALIKDDNSEVNYTNHHLIDAQDAKTLAFSLDNINNAHFKNIRFYLGVDSLHNHTGAQEGDLDPINDMLWTWNSGYIFFKHEGDFNDDTGSQSSIIYHCGSDKALTTITLSAPFHINGDTTRMSLQFDLNTLYGYSDTVNFNNNNFHQSVSTTDTAWIKSLKKNFPGAFTITSVQ